MDCKKREFQSWYTWCPQDHKGIDHYTLSQYLCQKMGPEWGKWWMGELEGLARHRPVRKGDNIDQLVDHICEFDAAEMVELLYPVLPELFLMPRDYSYEGKLNALARCAGLGSLACLETLLELGADPDGLDCPTGMNLKCLTGSDSPMVVVTPLDCARDAEQEECCYLLELYGARTAVDCMVSQE